MPKIVTKELKKSILVENIESRLKCEDAIDGIIKKEKVRYLHFIIKHSKPLIKQVTD